MKVPHLVSLYSVTAGKFLVSKLQLYEFDTYWYPDLTVKTSFCLSRGQLFKERGVGAVWTPTDSTALCTTERKKSVNTMSLHQNLFTANKCILHVKY